MYVFLLQVPCPDSPWQTCLEVRMADDCSTSGTIFMYEILQSGLIFCALVAGIASLLHVLCCRSGTCSNTSLFSIMMVAGLCHLVSSVYLLHSSEYLSERGNSVKCKQRECMDYYTPATVANTVILAVITSSILFNSLSTRLKAWLTCSLYIFTIFCGLYMSVNVPEDIRTGRPENDSLLSLGPNNNTHLDVFLSVCPTSISQERFRLWYEYSLIYLPMLIVVFLAWCKLKKTSKGKLKDNKYF